MNAAVVFLLCYFSSALKTDWEPQWCVSRMIIIIFGKSEMGGHLGACTCAGAVCGSRDGTQPGYGCWDQIGTAAVSQRRARAAPAQCNAVTFSRSLITPPPWFCFQSGFDLHCIGIIFLLYRTDTVQCYEPPAWSGWQLSCSFQLKPQVTSSVREGQPSGSSQTNA